MKNIEENELKNINGGISGWGIIGLSALGSFLVGVLNGFVYPSKCN